MGKMLLGFAAAAALSLPAMATAGTPEQPFVGRPNANVAVGNLGGVGFVNGVAIHSGFGNGGFGDGRFDHGHWNSGSSGDLGVWVNGGQWAQYNNQSFRSDSYNDWWHDNPNRAYPAWMRNNQGCDRKWFAGDTLRC
jgi:hypothetical protein